MNFRKREGESQEPFYSNLKLKFYSLFSSTKEQKELDEFIKSEQNLILQNNYIGIMKMVGWIVVFITVILTLVHSFLDFGSLNKVKIFPILITCFLGFF
jgi:hypothetical protein